MEIDRRKLSEQFTVYRFPPSVHTVKWKSTLILKKGNAFVLKKLDHFPFFIPFSLFSHE